jgi:hypothetical protein
MSTEANAAFQEGTTPSKSASAVDLSEKINVAVDRAMGETVRCVRVFGDNYRCNWWARDAAPAGKRSGPDLEVTCMRVRRSSFLKVTQTAEGLMIDGVMTRLVREEPSNP